MALVVRQTFAVAGLGAYVGAAAPPAVAAPSKAARSEIKNFARIMTTYIGRVANWDPGMAFDSTRALYQSLHLHGVVFQAALGALAAPAPTVTNAVNAMDAAVNAAVIAAANPLLPSPLVLGATAPAEAPLELVLETLLRSQAAPHTFLQGWNAITNFALGYNSRVQCGMPHVGALCFGNGQLVIAMNQASWARFNRMASWSEAARDASLDANYAGDVRTYSTRLWNEGGFRANPAVPQAHDLRYQWAHPAPGTTPDQSVMAAWNAINAALNPPVVPGPTFNRPNATTVLSFSCQGGPIASKARCRRCRVIFRFNMANGPAPIPTESQSYDAGPYPDKLTCAEVLAYEKCRWSGL